MTNKEIQIKLLHKYIEKCDFKDRDLYFNLTSSFVKELEKESDDCIIKAIIAFIFSHNFAQVFWGEKRETRHLYVPEEAGMFGLSVTKTLPAWMYHLQEMVLEKEPLKYIEKFL